MQQLYLPTSSLNFNAVFAEEAISPVAFYARRGFGYKRFETVAPNPHQNSLLLYDKYPHFDIQDSDRENVPIVFLLEDLDDSSVRPVHSHAGVTVYQTDGTLYLTPLNTSVLFRSKSDITTVVSASTRSLETKLVDLYDRQGCFGLQSDEPSFQWSPTFTDAVSDTASPLNEPTRLRHRRIDQLKGFMYAYALGAVAAIPQHVAELVRIARNVRNTVKSILGGVADTPKVQWDALLASLLELDQEYSRRHEPTKAFLDGLALKHQKHGMAGLLEDLCSVGGPEACHRFLTIWKRERDLYYTGVIYDILRNQRGESVTARVQQELNRMDQKITSVETEGKSQASQNAQVQLPSFKVADLGLAGVSDPSLDGTQADPTGSVSTAGTLCVLVNEVITKQYTPRDLTGDRLAVARSCGLAIKKEVEVSQWEGSSTERYVNSLLKNVGRGEAFEIASTDSVLLRSYAAFVLKGDDIEKLQDFVVAGRIGDFRIALGLHGALAGFSALPKTAMAALYSMEDRNVLDSIYQQIHIALHGHCPQGHLSRPPQAESPVLSDTERAIHTFEQLLKTKKVAKPQREAFSTEVVPIIKSGKNVLHAIAAWSKKAKKVTKKDLAVFMAKIECPSSTTPSTASAAHMTVEQELSFSEPQARTVRIPQPPSTFVDDQTCAQDLCRGTRDLDRLSSETRQALAESLDAFQKDYRPGGYYKERPDTYPSDNKNTVAHFMRCLSSPRTEKLNVPLTKEQRDAFTRWLKTRYAC